MLLFGWERAREVIQAWREWTAGVPDAHDVLPDLQVPDMPDVPEFVRGRGVVVIDGAVLAGASEAAEILAPLRALGRSSTRSPRSRRSRLSTSTWTPRTRCRRCPSTRCCTR